MKEFIVRFLINLFFILAMLGGVCAFIIGVVLIFVWLNFNEWQVTLALLGVFSLIFTAVATVEDVRK